MRRLGSSATEAEESRSVDLVDAALAIASRREFLSHDEALELLQFVQAGAPEGPPGAAIADIVSCAAASYSDQLTLDRVRVVNPLLDIRLALCE